MPRNWEKEDNMKKVFVLISGITFLFICFAVAQNVIDFESNQHDVVADGAYQAATPFFPGVIIRTIDNFSGDLKGWPIVVRAYDNPGVSDSCLVILDPGTVGGFDARYCSSINDTRNYPLPSGYNSLSDTAEPPVTSNNRKQHGFLVRFAYPVKDFSVGFADWGDYFPNSKSGNIKNPGEGWPAYIELIAYDENGGQIDVIQSSNLPNVETLNRDAGYGNDGIISLSLSASGIREVEVRFRGFIDPGVTIDDVTFLSLNIDIKPGSDPNCFNSNNHGVIPIAILGSADFDVTIINPSTVQLDGQEVRIKGKSGNSGSFEDVNDDGFTDLVVQIIDEGAYTVGDSMGIVTAETWSGELIGGQDSICITR